LIDPVFQIYCDSKEILEPKESFSCGHTMSSQLIFPAGAIDIDTAADYKKLYQRLAAHGTRLG
jgi:hypothetical protein